MKTCFKQKSHMKYGGVGGAQKMQMLSQINNPEVMGYELI